MHEEYGFQSLSGCAAMKDSGVVELRRVSPYVREGTGSYSKKKRRRRGQLAGYTRKTIDRPRFNTTRKGKTILSGERPLSPLSLALHQYIQRYVLTVVLCAVYTHLRMQPCSRAL